MLPLVHKIYRIKSTGKIVHIRNLQEKKVPKQFTILQKSAGGDLNVDHCIYDKSRSLYKTMKIN